MYEDSWRQINQQDINGPWEKSANFHIPIAFTFGKAIHARLWQIFSSPNGFFKVESRNEAFQAKEEKIKYFMDWVVYEFCNNNNGAQAEFDKWLWDVVFEGQGYLKCYWLKEQQEYREMVPVVKQEEFLNFDPVNLTGATSFKTSVSVEEQDVIKDVETPQIKRILWEDVMLPLGESDPQTAERVTTRIYMTTDEMKHYAAQGKFFKDAVDMCLLDTENPYLTTETDSGIKQERSIIDGYDALDELNQKHTIYEYYGPAYIKKDIWSTTELDADINETKREIVAWIHKQRNVVLGWTYLNRISPGGIRPIFRSDFVTIPDRSDGMGVPEMLYDVGRYADAVHNLKFDNGTLASIPMFAYRNSSTSLKPAQYRISPGKGIPVDDINDIKTLSFPYLNQFGTQETQELWGYAERMTNVNELTMGGLPSKVGALRNATGSNLISQESSIQLEPHFARIARCMNKLLQFLFRLCRERIKEETYFRVTGEKGDPVFGVVNRDDLQGDYDFRISVDLLGQSQLEKQQKAILAMQTLLNPTFMQTGIVTPSNLYRLAENFVRTQRLGRISDFVTEPEGYKGPAISAAERIYRIITNAFMEPPIEETVRLDENLEESMRIYEGFKNSNDYGLLTSNNQLAALEGLMAATQEMMAVQQAQGMPNVSGMQVPQDGIGAINTQLGGGGEALQSNNPGIEPNGPVV